MDPEKIRQIGLFFSAFLVSICFHEMAHAWMAKRKGDNTAQLMGRLSMNPVVHADILGTVILPILMPLMGGFLFGWAKPVPVNPRNLRHPTNDMFWIALAGPASNLILAFVGVLALVLCFQFHIQEAVIYAFLKPFIFLNLVLCFFNLIPLHPLDGGKILARFLPYSVNEKLEQMQGASSMILLLLFVTGGLRVISYPVQWTYAAMMQVVQVLIP